MEIKKDGNHFDLLIQKHALSMMWKM